MEWNLKNIDSIVEFINKKLSNGLTMKEIENDFFYVNERVIHKRLARLGYKRVNNIYSKTNKKDVIHPVTRTVLQENNRKNIKEIEVQEVLGSFCSIEEHNIPQLKENLVNLAKDYEIIKEIIEIYKSKDNIDLKKENELVIELPYEVEGKDFNTSIRVNKVIWNEFNEFCKIYKQFTKKELISQAFREFTEKYK